jgi:DNA repair exonuclease SbcCD ATPase subunit
MILFEKIRYKNFLSTGNQFTEINFTNCSTTLIIGNNGSGKSTILDALTFSLFGKSFRGVNKPQLINSVNEKDCVVEIEFKIGTTEWKVVRGIKPTIFEIYKNGNLLNQDSASKDQQNWLENVVLKMNYKSFTQIVILGSSNFIPFMQLSASNRREVIEDLLDIKIFSSMNSVTKDKIKSIRDEVKTFELKKESLEEKVSMQEKFIEEIENIGKRDIESKKESISFLTKEKDNLLLDSLEIEDKLLEKQKTLSDYSGANEKLRKLNNLKGKISQKISTITTDHKFFNSNTVCPTCTQEIDEDFRINKLNDVQNKAKELQSGYSELENAIKEEEEREHQFIILSKEVTSLTHEISQINTKISGYQRQIGDLEQEVQTITNQLKSRNTENDKLKDLQSQHKEVLNEVDAKKDLLINYSFIHDLLKDGGVKKKVIKKYLPMINHQVNRYLQMMEFFINFCLDEEFNESIQSPVQEDFSYTSFSEGERMRIDLALLFTWREIAKIKNSLNCNLIIFDETFDSSLDTFGTDEFMKIIRYVIKDSNTFVISHKEGMRDKFTDVLKFEKVKGFSRLAKV